MFSRSHIFFSQETKISIPVYFLLFLIVQVVIIILQILSTEKKNAFPSLPLVKRLNGSLITIQLCYSKSVFSRMTN
jgi:hypothetical protein